MIGPSDTAIALKCHDPAGTQIEISNEELLNHMLVLGATGSGKTSRVILPAFDDLCRGINGLVVFDGKGDAVFRKSIQESVNRHGRKLLEINGDCTRGFDVFAPMRALGVDGVSQVAEVLCCDLPVDVRNRYWDVVFRRVFENALCVLQLTSPTFEYDEAVEWIESYLLSYSRSCPIVQARIESLEQMVDTGSGGSKALLNNVRKGHQMWDNLDARTRSNHQSMAATVTTPLRSKLTRNYFDAEESVDISETLDGGNVIFVQVDGFGEKGLARLLGNFLKATFFRALMKREDPSCNWGLVSDDWGLTVSGGLESASSESAALPVIRSKKGFIIASCQSLAAIDLLVGGKERESAVANFGSLIFMRGRDIASDVLAYRTFLDPQIEQMESMCRRSPDGDVLSRTSVVRRIGGSHAPPGTLGSLATGEAMITVCEKVYEGARLLAPFQEIKEIWEV
ncbi:hypothetical protein VDG1235_3087 [Verrucomicrobiia bacterium DG1235]|nr:hypothetical protein VDG1235_3087 [Verrucomicrobiae bacterium DG1235]